MLTERLLPLGELFLYLKGRGREGEGRKTGVFCRFDENTHS